MKKILVSLLVLSLWPSLGFDFKAQVLFNGSFPTRERSTAAQDEQLFRQALTAYHYFYPTVSMEAVMSGARALGAVDNESIFVLSGSPRQVAFTANSDTPYSTSVVNFATVNEPLVIELPPGQLIGLVNDHNQGWIADMGLPGPDKGQGGKHLILPPGYSGAIPNGYYVSRATTNKILWVLRSMPEKGDVSGAIQALLTVKAHFLSTPDRLFNFIDGTQRDLDASALRWEDNLQFWEILHKIINDEPILEEQKVMFGFLQALGIEKGQLFTPDDRSKDMLTKAARTARDEMLVAAYSSTRPDRLAWGERRWEWVSLTPDSPFFDTQSGIDLEARDRWFIQAILTSPAMFRRTPGTGSLYWLGVRDADGEFLDGGKAYKLNIPMPVPAGLFWSVTVYDSHTRSQVQTDQNKAALSSHLQELKPNADGSLTLYFGPEAPKENQGQWIKTNPGKPWFAYFRIYGPQAKAFNSEWKPGDFELAQ
ncbi:MAG: DUF1254 domain-containing protein [Bdellovibrionales bacterium]|nr:DUF1254 domain-containing protein [Bdellovibrionales bacterium]